LLLLLPSHYVFNRPGQASVSSPRPTVCTAVTRRLTCVTRLLSTRLSCLYSGCRPCKMPTYLLGFHNDITSRERDHNCRENYMHYSHISCGRSFGCCCCWRYVSYCYNLCLLTWTFQENISWQWGSERLPLCTYCILNGPLRILAFMPVGSDVFINKQLLPARQRPLPESGHK
jgi:hypothetical protein